jgi:HSP20 family protein
MEQSEEGAMKLTRWEPFREMDDMFKGFAPLFGRLPVPREVEAMTDFLPPADIVEHEKDYLVKIDLPDVKKEDVKVFFDDGVLTVKGERRVEKEEKGEKMHRTERFFGTFERSFVLPDDVDPKLIRAESREGVLTLTLPKVATPKAKPVAISVQ